MWARLVPILGVLVILSAPSGASSEPGAAWRALDRPGAVAVMRHALAPGTGDPVTLTLGDCTTQRNLDARGRDQARAIGAALRARGVSFDRVLTSQWCRCRETAELLAVGPVQDFPALNSFFRDRSTRDAQTRDVRAFLADRPAGQSVMLVTHQVNISALTGRATTSGQVFVLDVGPSGSVEIVGDILLRP